MVNGIIFEGIQTEFKIDCMVDYSTATLSINTACREMGGDRAKKTSFSD